MNIVSVLKYSCILIGVAALGGSFYSYSDTKTHLEDAVKTTGTVIELKRHTSRTRKRSSDGRRRTRTETTYKPVVEFRTSAGALVRFTSSMSSKPPAYSKGDKIEVVYQKSLPEQARINSFFFLWGSSIISGILGFVFFLIGATMAFSAGRQTGGQPSEQEGTKMDFEKSKRYRKTLKWKR